VTLGDALRLLAWYRSVRRDLPWRREVSAYRTLVSELMLQQTRVETVVPYFIRFMQEFPTVERLAASPESRVLELWAGLGYYSRARNLHHAAKAVAQAGGFPTTIEGLRALPGVGPYTAGAIGSIALGLPAALVDGNVERVLARLGAMADVGAALRKRTWAAAERAVRAVLEGEAGAAGDFNQALMELGATVCTPRSPGCGGCPVAESCAGRGDAARYPAKEAKRASPVVRATALVQVEGGKIRLARRPAGLLGGLWEPAISGEWVAAVGVSVAEVTHAFSHRKLVVDVRVLNETAGLVGEGLRLPGPVLTTGDYLEERWVRLGEVEHLALSRLAWKVIEAAQRAGLSPADRGETQGVPGP